MVKVDAQKDGIGNIIISEESFNMLLSCLNNQKSISLYQHINQDVQNLIDEYNRECRKIIDQRYVFETRDEGYFLTKRYKYQDKLTPWSGDDVCLVYELFKDTRIEYKKPENLKPITNGFFIDGNKPLGIDDDGWIICEPEPRPWLIERSLRHDLEYLTISENGSTNRPWKEEEIKNIQELFHGCKVEPNNYYKEELWQEQLKKMDISIVEKYLRKIKIERL